MKIKPLGDRVVIQPLKEEKKKGGIIIAETVDKEKQEQGKVVAVGSGLMKDGKRIPLEVKKGDVVLFTKYGPSEVTIDGKELLIAKEEDILAVIETKK